MLRKRCLTPANECVNPMKRDMLQGSARTSGGCEAPSPWGRSGRCPAMPPGVPLWPVF